MKEILFFFVEFVADMVLVTSNVRHDCSCCCVGFSLWHKFSCRVMLNVHRYCACLWNTLCFIGGCWTLWLLLLCIGIYTLVCYKVVIH